MDQAVFERFRKIIYKECGIVISQEKMPLLANRINKRLMQLGLRSEGEYLEIIDTDLESEELVNLIDAVSTNVTHFYREADHFVFYRDYLSKVARTGNRQIKIWCAAASSGEEPYTLAFEASEALSSLANDFKILATDICTKVLDKALLRTYSVDEIKGVPAPIREKYFYSPSGNSSSQRVVVDEIAKHLLFKRMNLVAFPYPVQGPIDVIFCRNVMIYFDRPTRERIVKEFWRILRPGGVLVLSHSENLLGVNHSYTKLTGSIYQKNGNEGAE